MKKHITLVAFLLTIAVKAQTNCGNAVPITLGNYAASYAPNGQISSPDCINYGAGATNAIWYSFTPTVTQTLVLTSLIVGYPTPDTRLHVYTGTCGNLTCFNSNDDSEGTLAAGVTFLAREGTTYYIVFDNYWETESFHFALGVPTTPQYPVFWSQTLGLTGAIGVVDLNGDYLDDIVSPEANSVNVLYQSANGTGFTPGTLPTPYVNYLPNWSMAAGDYDKNGYNDLLYGSGSGAALLLANNNGTGFPTMHVTPQYVFSQRTNFVDINNDGNLDAFVCHDVAPNVYFLNDGMGGFTFHQGGLGDVANGGNYGSIWVDYDNDGDIDLFIAKCRGGNTEAAIDQLLRNNGDGTFTNVAQEAGFADYHQSWSSAWADFDNDGDMDVMIGASSDSNGSHKLMRNNGNGTFTNVTPGSGYDTDAMLNIEHVAHDFNNDGWVDILSGNRLMINDGDMTFTSVTISTTNAPIGDLNNDGFLDIYNGNKVYFNSDNGNHWLKVHLKGVRSNANGIGARVELHGYGERWNKQIRDVKSGDGFRYMSSLNTHFGLGSLAEIERVVIKWPSGTVDVVEHPAVDRALMVVEGSTLGITTAKEENFVVYPNPAEEVLNIQSTNQFVATSADIYSLEGKLIGTEKVQSGSIKVNHLQKGVYLITLKSDNGKQFSTKFIKG
jgi:hypothetical protein